MDLVDYYNDYWADKDDSVDRQRLGVLLSKIAKGKDVLQIDCGGGIFAAELMAISKSVTATEISFTGSKRAKTKGINTLQVDIDTSSLPFKDAVFDYVVSDSAIEHLFFFDKVIDEALRVLKKGGEFVLLMPNIAHFRFRLWLLFGRFPYIKDSPTDIIHLRFKTIRELKKLFAAKSGKIKDIDGTASLWVKGLYPSVFRLPVIRNIYNFMARKMPSLFARDFIIVYQKII